jgi:hypothetical protein
MLRAPGRIPLPTALDPSVGVTWLSALRTLGLSGLPLALAYSAVSLPAALFAFRAAWVHSSDAITPVALGLLACFFVSPYALGYDLAVLLVPLSAVLPRLSRRATVGVVPVALLGPYWHLSAVGAGLWQVTLFAWPVALAGLWVIVGFGRGEKQKKLASKILIT